MMENKLLNLISEDKISEAVSLASKLYNHSKAVRILVSQKARLKNLENLFIRGLTSLEDYNVETNKIRFALISFVQELGESSELDDKIKQEIATFEKVNSKTIIQNHSGTGHNIGGDFINGDKY